MIAIYAGVYDFFCALNACGLQNALYFSIVTFTTLGYGDITPTAEFRLLAASEALVGVMLTGLFLFCLARRAFGRA